MDLADASLEDICNEFRDRGEVLAIIRENPKPGTDRPYLYYSTKRGAKAKKNFVWLAFLDHIRLYGKKVKKDGRRTISVKTPKGFHLRVRDATKDPDLKL